MEPTRISDAVWEIDREDDMRVPGRIYASDAIMEAVLRDRSVDQVANAAHLPGIVEASFAMPDIHWGYGFPIGGVAATDIDDGGVVSPGGVRPSISVPWASPFSSPGAWEPRRSVRRRMVKAG